ncbi:hypothetical protein M0804_000341 [Polistes exclamans]|nr:hypothetical protein M0804_000341 [Polistes exclamans]
MGGRTLPRSFCLCPAMFNAAIYRALISETPKAYAYTAERVGIKVAFKRLVEMVLPKIQANIREASSNLRSLLKLVL